MTTAMKIGMEHLNDAFQGKDPKALINVTTTKMSSESELISLIKDAVKKLASQSTQRFALLPILYQSYTMESLNDNMENGFIGPSQFSSIGKKSFCCSKEKLSEAEITIQ